jgi:hypothetical protein
MLTPVDRARLRGWRDILGLANLWPYVRYPQESQRNARHLRNLPMSPRRLRTLTLAALVTTLALAACGSVKETMLERGFPPAYAEGYADGCSSGNKAAGGLFDRTRKDMTRYGADRQYTQGWDAGFRRCRAEMAATVESDRRASGQNGS